MKNIPTFSVIIPTHNRAQLLERALSSIRMQNFDHVIEIIVISDIVDTKTHSICEKYLSSNDIYMERNGQCGPSESRNLGLKLSKGKYIIFLDDDDAWNSDYIKNLIINPIFQNDGFVYSNCTVIKEQRLPEGPKYLSTNVLNLNNCLTEDVYVKNQIHMSCFVFPRFLLDNIEFDVNMRAYEDWEFLLAVFDKMMPTYINILSSCVYEVPDETTDRRGNSNSAQDFNAVLDYLYVYRRHPSSNISIRNKRSHLLHPFGLNVNSEYL